MLFVEKLQSKQYFINFIDYTVKLDMINCGTDLSLFKKIKWNVKLTVATISDDTDDQTFFSIPSPDMSD